MLYAGNSIFKRFGNSFFNKAKATPSEAIMGSKPFSSNAFIIGIHLVACPKPQFNGAMTFSKPQ